ncbi:hypothetical protein CVT24_009253 [Panaeolus cyanescens]|uniref:NADH:flavin oxidoreductase/NADH oxidase N-terminal domain-containing protein n=1 Tax=Panaeolus cyanescens TaxID=181874 RepID=A0A409Y8H4_9AGAR|nr:hypothetical protein CVT24_009253 [Panaeolus cyanescens]
MTSSEKFTALFKPLQIGDIMIKNRITMSALTRNRAVNTYPTELMKEYYLQRVRGDTGLIVTEGILVSRQGTEWPLAPGIWDDKHVEGWKNIVDAVHQEGGKIYAQLWHVGRVAHPDAPEQKLSGTPVYAPSAISARGGKFRHIHGVPGYVTPTAIDDPRIIIAQFKHAAVNAKRAGFDGVEFPLGVTTTMPLDETIATYSYFITEADKLGLSYFALYRYVPTDQFHVSFEGVLRATAHDVVGTFRPYIKNAKVIVNSGVTAEEGELLVREGHADAIAIGFDFITHPDLAKRVAHGYPLDNVPDIPHLQTNKASTDFATGYTDYPFADL